MGSLKLLYKIIDFKSLFHSLKKIRLPKDYTKNTNLKSTRVCAM